jgi:hypothetical protein
MKASEMLCLVQNLSLMIGDLISNDDPVWCFYICLRKILDIVLAAGVCDGQLTLLSTLVIERHEEYILTE